MKILMMSLFVLLSCSHHEHSETQNPGPLKGVQTFKHVGLAGDQTGVDFERYKKAGYKKIVNLRSTNEEGYSKKQLAAEKKSAEQLGLIYLHAPFLKEAVAQQSVSQEMMEQIEKSVHTDENDRSATLVHCSSAARASAWFFWHLSAVHGLEVSKARSMAYELSPKSENTKKAFDAVEKLLRE
jgi:protein tyrosine phosphatase (PTP) superfamily phosphohydrolase (DUF442 family)